jgi:hypothetical protein
MFRIQNSYLNNKDAKNFVERKHLIYTRHINCLSLEANNPFSYKIQEETFLSISEHREETAFQVFQIIIA